MSPARGKKAKSKSKKTARPSRPATKPRSKPKTTGKAPAKKPGKPAKATSTGRRHCAATDPFGDPCQSAPRMSSKYCTIHSYLDR